MLHLHINSFIHFLKMGGYARFVWPAYATVMISFVTQFWAACHELSKAKQQLRKKYAEKTEAWENQQ